MKSAHSTRNRYSSQWTLTKCQASTPARTLTSDWRTVGSQHGITVTESDSYSASLSQDTGVQGHSLPGTAWAGLCCFGVHRDPKLGVQNLWTHSSVALSSQLWGQIESLKNKVAWVGRTLLLIPFHPSTRPGCSMSHPTSP